MRLSLSTVDSMMLIACSQGLIALLILALIEILL
jgi:hypothetical protein